MRTKNSIKNLLVSWGAQLLNIVFQFSLRTIFIVTVSAEYLGINGLFSNILYILSFMELGVASAISYSLYKPLAENNYQLISSIMNFYKKLYFAIGILVFILGISVLPVLDFVIADNHSIPNISLIYFLWIFNSSISYFYIYRSTLIIADQRKDIVELNNIVFKFLQIILQIIILLLYRNYILYLLIQIVFTILGNISISYIAIKRYDFLNEYRKEKVNKRIAKEIKKYIKATFLHKIGAVLIFGTDNILISKFFGLSFVGIYSNYYLIINTLSSFIGQIQGSIISSVGNLGAVESDSKKLAVFKLYYFLNFTVFCITSSCLFSLLDPFVKFWIGEEYTLDIEIVALLTVNYFITGFRSAAATFCNAFGLFLNTRKLPIIEGILNLFLSVILLKYLGLIGVFLGTFFSSILTGAWYEPYILYKFGFKSSVKHYFIKMFIYFFIATFIAVTSRFLVLNVSISGLIGIVIQFISAPLCSSILLMLIFIKTNDLKNLITFIRKFKGR